MSEGLATVVTVCRNVRNEVRRTIDSIQAQSGVSFEWIVVDGASTDGTPDVFRSSGRAPDTLISEPDGGIADAMNKGVRLAHGDSILFMNAGDAFAAPDALASLVSGWDRTRHSWAYGDSWVHAADGNQLYLRREVNASFNPLLNRRCGVQHAAAIVEKSLFSRLGPFDTSYRLTFDYEFWVRCFAAGFPPVHIPTIVSRFYLGGASGNIMRRDAEWRLARKQHGLANGGPVEAWLYATTAAKVMAGPLARRFRWTYRAKEALGW
jgi:glycosyltransferase involved in cell wall biosynthesis